MIGELAVAINICKPEDVSMNSKPSLLVFTLYSMSSKKIAYLSLFDAFSVSNMRASKNPTVRYYIGFHSALPNAKPVDATPIHLPLSVVSYSLSVITCLYPHIRSDMRRDVIEMRPPHLFPLDIAIAKWLSFHPLQLNARERQKQLL